MSDERSSKELEEHAEDLEITAEDAKAVKGGDAATGQAAAKRRTYNDFSFSHSLDKSSPVLL